MGKSLRVAYGEALVKLGQKNDKIVALDADLAHATMSATFAEAFPDRFFNAGIAECNMMGMAAGFAHTGYIPFEMCIRDRPEEVLFPVRLKVQSERSRARLKGCGYKHFHTCLQLLHA